MATHILLNLNTHQTFPSINTRSPSPSPSTSEIFNTILQQLNEWIAFIPNLFHSLLEKLDKAFPPESRAYWVAVATYVAIAAVGVIILYLLCCCCLPVIISCISFVVFTIWNLISGLFKLLWMIICKVYNIFCCCGRRSMKMMKAPGSGGRLTMPRASFENNPAAYFSGLRAGRLPTYVS